jgi:hypothetical protein
MTPRRGGFQILPCGPALVTPKMQDVPNSCWFLAFAPVQIKPSPLVLASVILCRLFNGPDALVVARHDTGRDTWRYAEHHLRLLQLCCEAWDRCQAARVELDRDGLTVPGREGGCRPHPAVAIERDSRLACARLLRELDLDSAPAPPARIAPPPLFSNSRHARKIARS